MVQLNTSQGDCHTVSSCLTLPSPVAGAPLAGSDLPSSPPQLLFLGSNTLLFLVGLGTFLKVGCGELCFLDHLG